MTTTSNYTIIQVKITEFDIDWDWNPWDMPPDYGLEREMRDSTFEVEIDPSLTEDENRQWISDQIREEAGFMWNVENMDWVEVSA